ncbi:MAG: hypothetical protein HY071_04745, partial [Chloroflexi bacterium]|nr:hypothetical protein [Chloroflexota bacterium]
MRSFSRLVILATVAVLCAVAPRAFAQEDVGPDDASPEGSGTDLFLGSASATIPIVAPPGAAGITPRIVIHYRSSYVDDISARTQGHTAGLGWMLDWGPIILREASTSNLKLQLAGTTYPLVLIDGSQNIYHTKDESFLKLQYFPSGDYWILTSKDGTQHRLGYNAESRANGISGAYKYLVDQTSTTSGVAIRYAYVKQTATLSSGQTYDQAVYIDSIAYAYQGGSAIGDLRQVQFFRAARADWTDPGGTTPSYVDKQRLDAIEVRVGGALVRRYQLAFDYSNDRDGSYNWGGGVAGDLTLRSVTTIGADGTSTLPPRTFTYTNNRLGTATNGLGGSVTYTYEHLATTPLNVAWTGTEWAPSTASGNVVGFIFPGSVANTTPVYKACMRLHQQCDFYALEGGGFWYCYNIGACDDYGGSQNLDQFSLSSILGYCPANLPGTIPMYSVCTQPTYYCYVSDATQSWQCTSQVTGCIDWAIGNVPDQWGLSSFLTYAYVSAIDRYRVVSKAVNDGRGTTSTTTYSYTDIALSSDGTEFRGHGQVRASDPLGHFVDTWFKQDDAFKSRPYHVQIRRNDGALMQEIAHTWTAATPYAGATFASLTRTDVSECDGLSACRQSARTFEYDAYGNPTRVYSYGDLAVSADERDRRLEWVVDATAWIHRPSHSVQYDAAGALVRERWLSFDGGAWGTLGGRGLATRVEE